IALGGQAGAVKTSLVEALLLQAGAIRSRGSLARGSTVSDFDPQERRLQHSLDTAICSFDFNGIHVNLIDTPGYADFLGKALSVLEAVEEIGRASCRERRWAAAAAGRDSRAESGATAT